MEQSRKDGFKAEELKLYWNIEQLENLCTKPQAHDPSDLDAIDNLHQYPVEERKHSGTITYINEGIQTAVFKVPENAQIIVLNFAVQFSLEHLLIQSLNTLYRTNNRLEVAI